MLETEACIVTGKTVCEMQISLGMNQVMFCELIGIGFKSLGNLKKNPLSEPATRAQIRIDRLSQIIKALESSVAPLDIPNWLDDCHIGFPDDLSRAELLKDDDQFPLLLEAIQ